MCEINERRIVHCPESEASHRLAEFVAERRLSDGSLNIALRLPTAMLATFKLPIERRGVASFYSLQSAADPRPTYSVAWTSKGGWPFPDFAGALAVEQVLLPRCFGLVLRGYYQQPLAHAVPSWDSETDWRIAHGLTRELLRSIAEFVEKPPWPRARAPRSAFESLPVAS
jgi:hypothetical protein